MPSSDHDSMPPPSLPTPTPTVEYKKDGSVSRMRSHRGNVPQLPQTKLCPFCPAKFTRTTHLNRHLRNHTNERLYRCEVCGAQFTRSDLLARHKRSCGESHPISRSRKRSCQACTSLKVKCDLRQPCSKCRARGRECVYATEEGPKESIASSSNGQQNPESRFSGPIVRLDASAGFDPSTLERGSTDALSATFPELSLIEEASRAISQPLSEANLAAFLEGAPRLHHGAMSLPTIDADSDITASSFRVGQNHAFTAFGASEVAGHSRGLHGFSSTMFEPFFRDVFSIQEESSQQNECVAPLLHAPDTGTLVDGFSQPDYTLTFPNDVQSLDANLDKTLMSDLLMNVYCDKAPVPLSTQEPSPASIYVASTLPAALPPPLAVPNVQPMYPSNVISDPSRPPLYTQKDLDQLLPAPHQVDAGPPDPTTEELQQYLYVFLTAFLPQIPVVHTPTLRFELKPPMLLRAMQACGALFVKTPVAQAFVEKMLCTSRDVLIREFAGPSSDPRHQIHSIMTLILLQTIGLFHQDPQQRASSNIYHGMLVLMIRQHHLIERSTSWEHQVFPTTDPDVLEATWRNWAVHEAIKRVVCLAYCHDQAHRIFFSLPPSFSPEELAICLPCDDELWAAKTPLEWSQLLLAPSPYGSVEERIHGVPMHRAFAAVGLECPNPPKELSAVSPFGHFILLQALLAELFRRCSRADSPTASPDPGGEEQVNEHVYAMQLALHRWLQMWLKTPNANASPDGNLQDGAETCDKFIRNFMADPLPHYWLAHLLLLAFQEGLPPFCAREALQARGIESSEIQGLHEPSPFAPSDYAPSPFSSSSFAPSPFSSSGLSSGSSPVLSTTPPPAYRSPSGLPPPSGSGTARFGVSGPGTPDGAQFHLVKRWLYYIRMFLRRTQGSPTIVWDELMKIRLVLVVAHQKAKIWHAAVKRKPD
ncbi:fungal-specific transcription factor domain-containing protein [Russula earlei]|uniref:Fungal-specific transcription factor domain-containing protein n=1 Tax=Russula earlei TaxID=71964 RepID=A0ACC0UET4_9AGAM|nr:fungal-specific transcription factor domain-containing protein [Russula earlei]